MKGTRLMTILEHQRLLAENSLFFLQTVLYYIARPDLYELVHEFRTKRQNDLRKLGVEITYGSKWKIANSFWLCILPARSLRECQNVRFLFLGDFPPNVTNV